MIKVSLVISNGRHRGQRLEIRNDRIVIGRHEDCDLRLDSSQISRRHCAITIEKGRVFIRDFGSRNGTIVNRRRIGPEVCQLWHRDTVQVGELKFRLSLRDAESGRSISGPESSEDEPAMSSVPAIGDLPPPEWKPVAPDAGDAGQLTTELLGELDEMTSWLELNLEKAQQGWRELDGGRSREAGVSPGGNPEDSSVAPPVNAPPVTVAETLQDDRPASDTTLIPSPEVADESGANPGSRPMRIPEHLRPKSPHGSQDAAQEALRRIFRR